MSRIILPGPMELAYPTHNYLHLPLEFTDRKIEVASVIDFCRTPLDARRFIRRPLCRRGRLLLKAIDETGALKKFWVDAQHGGELPAYRLGLYDPAFPGELVDWIGRVFGPSERDRVAMRRVARQWYQIVRERGEIGLKLAAWPWEG